MNQQQANEVRSRQDVLRTFLGDRTSYRPEEVAHLNPPTNAELSELEVFELHRDKPERFTAYVSWGGSNIISTWVGDRVAVECRIFPWHTNNFGGKWRQITIKAGFIEGVEKAFKATNFAEREFNQKW